MGRGHTRSIRTALGLTLVAVLAGVVVATARATAFDDGAPCPDRQPLFVCPQGTVDAPYSIQLQGRAGCTPYEYRILSGALPSGLSLSQGGVINGSPVNAGTSNFWLELKDVGCPPDFGVAEREFSISIQPRVLVTSQSAGPATIGSAYTLNLSAAMKSSPSSTAPPSSPLTWTVVQGQLPTGLVLDSGTGVISGTPTAEGASLFVVRAALADGRSDTKGLEITVRQPLAIQAPRPFAAAPVRTLWEVGVPFTAKLGAIGGTGTYTWSLAEGALPTGLALAADGTVTGRPSAAGPFQATLRLADNEGRIADYSAAFGVAARLAIKTQRVRKGKVGKLYRAKLSTRGGVLPTKWKATKGRLPRGIRLDRKLGVLSGTPKKPGRYRVTFEATDAFKVKSKKTLFIFVLAK